MTYRLSIRDLSVSLGDTERRFTLRTGSWDVEAGAVIGFTGPSGTGKTLLLELLGLLRAPASGQYCATAMSPDGQDMPFETYWGNARSAVHRASARARFFGFVPQSGGLLPYLTVSENIALSQQIAQRADRDWLGHLIEQLGLGGVAGLRPAALSIGQRQRVAIARALAHRPFCVIADEPTASLDPENAETAMGLLIRAAKDGGSATLLSSHDYATLDKFDMTRMRLEITSPHGDKEVVSSLTSKVAETVS